MKYDALLCLSGGKDSCSLAFKLKDKGLSILAFTNDVGFMSPIAFSNIRKVLDALDIDHVMVKPRASIHKKFIDYYFNDPTQNLDYVCLQCTKVTMANALSVANSFGIKTIVAGFTKYHVQAIGIDDAFKMELAGVSILNPYCKGYNLKKIEEMLQKYDIVTDPRQTNCAYLPRIIATDMKRFGKCSIEEEFNLLLGDKQITESQYHEYRKWILEQFQI